MKALLLIFEFRWKVGQVSSLLVYFPSSLLLIFLALFCFDIRWSGMIISTGNFLFSVYEGSCLVISLTRGLYSTILPDVVRVACNMERRFQAGSLGGAERGGDSLAPATPPCNADPPASRRPALPTSPARPHNTLIINSVLCFHARRWVFPPFQFAIESLGVLRSVM